MANDDIDTEFVPAGAVGSTEWGAGSASGEIHRSEQQNHDWQGIQMSVRGLSCLQTGLTGNPQAQKIRNNTR